ncbi:CDP-diacylglycerol--serine O-phosphatidyltransferase [Rhodoplanes roseus]|uniref:CDP-diacylglycerol--serine O-phosphatidyltransferase n=1 Tax=Rhodoplanes roseus TaxID=29409 RepID=A0A327KRC6_9BRAD|nr:CDP-diacylglycerol--serine O-phosphatidyltransferase [Rhodoplanes roseus]RAI39905.1 CDP-diacylglycerol--serine O-phosphatidyltransferase [Rhodoplanes roseus]
MSLFPPFDPDRDRREPRRRAFRPIPVRTLVPNIVTLLSLCAGLTAIRLGAEGRFELALAGIVFAAVLDGVDGRLARMLKGTSRFGAELDSLADFVNFGVAPALILYFWGLHDFKNVGWIVAIVFAICCGLRLARFNVMIDDPTRPAWAGNFFTGIPAPAGAIVVLLPLYLQFLGVSKVLIPTSLVLLYTLAIGILMISKLPVWSGKKLGTRVAPELVLPAFVLAVLFFALLISYPWEVLTVGTLIYLGCLPLGWKSYRRQAQADADRAAGAAAPAGTSPTGPATTAPAAAAEPGPAPPAPSGPEASHADRPTRLN